MIIILAKFLLLSLGAVAWSILGWEANEWHSGRYSEIDFSDSGWLLLAIGGIGIGGYL